ncbi:MAG: response regulator [Chloroflexota bacterium]|nr:response regulator [Chloroflexota bacterium]
MTHILLVEDNQSNADLMIRLLETEGYTVKHCTHGLEGVRSVQKDPPALILMDFNLPDVDGRTLILTLKRRTGAAQSIPIIAVTARTGIMEEVIAERFGCDAFVRKPFDPQEFIAVVQQFMKKPAAPNGDSGASVGSSSGLAHPPKV